MNLVETGIRARRKTAGVIRRRFPSRKLTFHLGSAGQLGNQLWQIAGTIAIARRNGAEAVFRNDWPYRPFFAIPEARYANRLSAARCHEAWPLATSIVEEWRICLQDVGLWAGYEDLILGELRPSERALEEAGRFHELLSLPSPTALHVRRGDYTSGLSFHRPCPVAYYEEALALLQQDAPDATLLVFSDEIAWCRRHLRLEADTHFVEGNPNWLDLTIMSLCRHHICANSTFSWWGAFMSSDPSPIVPWLLDVSPEAFRAARPAHWRELEIASDPLEAPAQPHLRLPPPHPGGTTAGRGTWARPGRVAPAFRDDSWRWGRSHAAGGCPSGQAVTPSRDQPVDARGKPPERKDEHEPTEG